MNEKDAVNNYLISPLADLNNKIKKSQIPLDPDAKIQNWNHFILNSHPIESFGNFSTLKTTNNSFDLEDDPLN